MSWEHKIARELKDRDNPSVPQYLIGTVISGSPLRVSIYNGSVILSGNQVKRVDPKLEVMVGLSPVPCALAPLNAGERVALVGDQTYIVLGTV